MKIEMPNQALSIEIVSVWGDEDDELEIEKWRFFVVETESLNENVTFHYREISCGTKLLSFLSLNWKYLFIKHNFAREREKNLLLSKLIIVIRDGIYLRPQINI